MSATRYTFQISTAFPNQKVAVDRLTAEIRASSIVTALDYIGTLGNQCDIWFKDVLSANDQTTLEQLVSNHNGTPLPDSGSPVRLVNSSGLDLNVGDDENRLVTVPVPRKGDEFIAVTHNFCDPTTWYTNSVRHPGVIMTASVGDTVFTCPFPNWIDMTHGKMFNEDELKTEAPHHYSASIWVDGSLKTEREPFVDSGGDFTIDYRSGSVTFFSPVTGTVTASFSYATDSTWILAPDEGKYIDIELAEVQFGLDTNMNDSVEFQIWAYNPNDLPNKVMVDKTTYKTVRNVIDEAIGSYPVIKSFGGSTRGMGSDVYGFPFRYGAVRSVRASQGIELRIKLKNDIPFSGTYTTATFYTTVHNE